MYHRLSLPIFVAALLLTGCSDREIASYRAPKDPAPAADLPPGLPANHPAIGGAATPADAMANTTVPTASGADLVWTAPDGWSAKPGSAMRKGSYAVPGEAGAAADMSITAFPGDTGGLASNLNRWRDQVGLPPQSDAEVVAASEKLSVNGLDVVVVEYVGAAGGVPTRMLGAVIPHAGNTWFFKLTGPDALVATQKPAFLQLINSVKPAQP